VNGVSAGLGGRDFRKPGWKRIWIRIRDWSIIVTDHLEIA
jgi:hypothetical protein